MSEFQAETHNGIETEEEVVFRTLKWLWENNTLVGKVKIYGSHVFTPVKQETEHEHKKKKYVDLTKCIQDTPK